jgi:hypothetical protein
VPDRYYSRLTVSDTVASGKTGIAMPALGILLVKKIAKSALVTFALVEGAHPGLADASGEREFRARWRFLACQMGPSEVIGEFVAHGGDAAPTLVPEINPGPMAGCWPGPRRGDRRP